MVGSRQKVVITTKAATRVVVVVAEIVVAVLAAVVVVAVVLALGKGCPRPLLLEDLRGCGQSVIIMTPRCNQQFSMMASW